MSLIEIAAVVALLWLMSKPAQAPEAPVTPPPGTDPAEPGLCTVELPTYPPTYAQVPCGEGSTPGLALPAPDARAYPPGFPYLVTPSPGGEVRTPWGWVTDPGTGRPYPPSGPQPQELCTVELPTYPPRQIQVPCGQVSRPALIQTPTFAGSMDYIVGHVQVL